MTSSKNCPICSEPILETAESSTLQKKGTEGVNRCSKQRDSNLVVQSGTKCMSIAGEDTKTNKTSRSAYLVFLFKHTSLVYKKGEIELLSCHEAVEIMVYCVQKTMCVIKELQFKNKLIFLAKILHVVSTQDYLQ